MSAILDRPHAFGAKAARPEQQVIKRAPLGLDRPVSEDATGRGVDRADGVRVLVGVRPDHDHPHRPFVGIPDERMPGGQISVGAMPRSYQVTPGSSDGGGRHNIRRSDRLVDRKSMGQPVASPRTYRPRRTPPPDQPTLSLRKSSALDALWLLCESPLWVRVTDEAKRRRQGLVVCRAAMSFEDL